MNIMFSSIHNLEKVRKVWNRQQNTFFHFATTTNQLESPKAPRFDPWFPLRQWLDGIEVQNRTRKKLGSKVTPRLFKAGRKNDAATLVAMTCYNSKARVMPA